MGDNVPIPGNHLQPPLALPMRTVREAERILLATALVAVVTDDDEFLGRFVSGDDTTVILSVTPEMEAEIPVADIRRIERVSSRGAQGALIGAMIGAIPLAVVSWKFGDWVRSGPNYYWVAFVVLGLPVVGGLGAIGGLIGLAFNRRQPIFVARESA